MRLGSEQAIVFKINVLTSLHLRAVCSNTTAGSSAAMFSVPGLQAQQSAAPMQCCPLRGMPGQPSPIPVTLACGHLFTEWRSISVQPVAFQKQLAAACMTH